MIAQEKAIYRTKPILANAIEEVYKELVPEHMVIVDLGCSSGPNTFIVVSQVLNIIVELRRMMEMKKPLEVQFLLNDLPGNDFNYVFQSLHKFKKKVEEETKGELLVPYYVVPKELEHEQGVPLNKGNIYWTETTPQVEKAYREQYKKDFLTFLRSRYTELNMGGGMVLTFLGRRKRTPGHGDLCHLYGLLAEALNSMVLEGILSEEKVDTFNLPLYGPFLEDVKSVIHHEGLFNLDRVEIFESNWDPFDDSEDHSFNFALRNYTKSAKNVADCIRAVLEPLIVHQFGDAILDDLFTRYTHNVSKHLIKEKANHTILVFALKKCI
ncbi:hypothetical protein ZIOFF_039563 [Zingiber officinale]|uniref:Uncharacterized protein n=1 Tax=Zingiber officinale TaxID=94328 RepID=A0A8J5G509_ZINOF|nr:hypothetical protein ZIOFF_039563 [Zingiber officinale]